MKGALLVYSAILCVLSIWAFQNRLLYDCNRHHQALSPNVFGLPSPIQDPDKGFLHSGTLTLFPYPNATLDIYFFHGNGMRVRDAYWHLGHLYKLCKCNIYAIEPIHCTHPSFFGNSWYAVTRTNKMVLWYMLNHKHTNVLMGVSQGTAHVLNAYPYLYGSHRKAIDGIILENPYTSTLGMLKHYLGDRLGEFVIHGMFQCWNNDIGITYVYTDVPVLFLTSEQDEIVPPYMSRQLADKCPSRNQTHVVLEGALHGHAGAHPKYLPAIRDWLGQIQK